MALNKITVSGVDIRYKHQNESDFFSLTDIAKYKGAEFPSEVINAWLRTRGTVEFLGLWERLYNPNFNSIEFDRIEKEAGRSSFMLSPTKWTESVNAVGIVSKQGRYAEAYAHKDIAFKFASWISVEFELYIIKEFQRLKVIEQQAIEWTAKRELSKVNYRIHTDAIKENLIIPELTQTQKSFVYADEADLLNVALFGKTAKEWRATNQEEKGNMRDYATIHQLLVLANMESHNASFIIEGLSQEDRLIKLRGLAERELRVLSSHAINSHSLFWAKDKNKR
ncbi:MAG: KilA-N domain-containing protein [Firmicutes bacterium]|nr:KilA-N domain-containing protein [Bacillota bacterium]